MTEARSSLGEHIQCRHQPSYYSGSWRRCRAQDPVSSFSVVALCDGKSAQGTARLMQVFKGQIKARPRRQAFLKQTQSSWPVLFHSPKSMTAGRDSWHILWEEMGACFDLSRTCRWGACSNENHIAIATQDLLNHLPTWTAQLETCSSVTWPTQQLPRASFNEQVEFHL